MAMLRACAASCLINAAYLKYTFCQVDTDWCKFTSDVYLSSGLNCQADLLKLVKS